MLFTHVALAAGGVVRIPLNTFTKPPSDLKLNNQDLSFSDLAKMHQQGFDLSTINPVENKYWQNQKYSAVDSALHEKMPQPETGVQIDSYLGANRELGFYSVVIKNSQNEKYILTLGQQVHSSLLKSALLRKLGHYQESPKYYTKIKIDFLNIDEKNRFINSAFCENGPSEEATDCLSISPFKTDTNNKEYLSHAGPLSLYVHACYLEKMNSEVPSLFDGLTPASSGSASYFSTARAFRGLLVPFVIADLGESINRVSTQSVMVRDGWANINYGFDQYFEETNADDVKWALRRAGNLSDQDWNEIVEAGKFPQALNQLVKAKILYRLKNFVDSFYNKNERRLIFNLEIPEIKYNSADGYVKNGKVVTESIPGYPQRFSNGDRQSPFESGDFLRYMKVKGISSTIGIAVNKLQEYLKTSNDIPLDSKIKGFEVSRRGIRTIGHQTGLNVGLNYAASRTLTTGTFFGSQAPIQLVDNISLTAGIGVMHSINEIGGYGINGGSNVSYARDFTHVRPLNSIKESSRVSWADINVESKLKKLVKLLDAPKKLKNADKISADVTAEIPDADDNSGFVSFMSELRSGEVFLISDSISGSAQVGVNAGIDSLIGFYAGSISPTVGLSAGGAKILLRQIQITKTDDGLQIFVRNQNSKAFSLTFDFNYFINLLKIKNETLVTDLHTDAFLLNYNSEFVSKGEKGDFDFSNNEDLEAKYQQQRKFGQQIASAIRGLISQSSTDQLYAHFKYQQFNIDHMLKTNAIKTKILWYRATQLKEEHLLTIQKPILNTTLNAIDAGQVVNEPIQIVSYRKGELVGRDYLGFGLDLADGASAKYLKGFGPTLSQATQNPTQIPFGKAEWRIVKTESEITRTRTGALPTVATVQHVWGGWSISRDRLDQILETIKERIKGTEYDGSELIPANVLHNVKKLNFFRVAANLTLLPTGIDKIKSLLINPDTAGIQLERPDFVRRLLRKLVQAKDPARLEDKAIYNSLITLLGNGDFNLGRTIYMNQCMENRDENYTYSLMKGTTYECLEPWVEKLIKISRLYNQSSIRDQNKMMTEMIYALEEKIPLSTFLKYLGQENYVFYIDVSGFRTGDENADDGSYMSNIIGKPEKKRPYSNGLISIISDKSKIISTELDRTQADFQ